MKKKIAAIVTVLILTTTTVFAATLFDTPHIGNAYRMTFHYRDCPSIDEMNPKNQVPLNIREESIAKSYRPCGNCKP